MNKIRYFLVLMLAFGLLYVNYTLVEKVINNEVEFDIKCPLPLDIGSCQCYYNQVGNTLSYCNCFPKGVNISSLPTGDKIDSFDIGSFWINNITKNQTEKNFER